MAVDTFIPEVWSAELQLALAKRTVFAQPGVSNRNYEGDIAEYGDTVHITKLARPTISTYTKNVTAISPQTLTTTEQLLAIDQSKYFAFEVDDVDARQVRDGGALLTDGANDSAQGLAETIDTFVATAASTGAGTIMTPAAIATADAAFLWLRNARVALDRASVPVEGRFVVVSPEFYGLILGDARFIDASRYGSTDPIQNGEVGRAIGFTVFVSVLAPAGTAGTLPAVSSFIFAGHPMAITFASQINKVEAYRPQDSFSDAVKGLALYGAKVVRAEALVAMDADITVV